MKDLNTANIYAKILFKNALEQKANLKELSQLLGNIANILNESKYLVRFLSSSISKENEKTKVINDILKMVGKSELLSKFMLVLVRNNKVGILGEIHQSFEKISYEKQGLILADLTLAKEFSKKEFDKCVSDLEKKLGKKFLIKKNIDPSLIGGMILKFGSNMYDFSVSSLFKRLR